MQPTIKEFQFPLKAMLWQRSSFHWRFGKWQHLSCQGKVDVKSDISSCAARSQQTSRAQGPTWLCCPHLSAVPCLWSMGSHPTSSNFEYSTVGWEKQLQPTQFASPSTETLSCVRNDRENICFDLECLPSYLANARDSKSVNEQQSEEGI